MTEAPDFEALYRHDHDPYRVRTSWYERRKLAVVLASLSRPRYAIGWDAACGTGDLAHSLASRCDHVLASDLSERAVQITQELVAGHAGTDVTRRSLPAPPVGGRRPDLVILAEVLYYLPEPTRAETYSMVDQVATWNGRAEVVTVHWRHHPDDAHLSGAAVTDEMGAALGDRGWAAAVIHDDVDFVLASWIREPEPA